MEEKKSFLMYYDAYPLLTRLPREQQGLLLMAVYEYAMRVGRGDVDPEAFLGEYPDMAPGTWMACAFLCTNIRRDTKKWRQQRDARVRRRTERETPAAAAAAAPDPDTAWMRKYIQQRQRENADVEGGGAWK